MLQKTEFIWFDGKLVPWDQAQVHVLAHGLHYGTGVFEGIRAYACPDGSSAVFRLPEHSKRLVNSAKILGINMPYTADEISRRSSKPLGPTSFPKATSVPSPLPAKATWACSRQQPHARHHRRVALGRLLGAEASKGHPHQDQLLRPYARQHPDEQGQGRRQLCEPVLAKMEVKQDGYDEALMLDTNGYVCEATGENFFIVRNGVIKTPPLTAILDGITRDSIIKIARDLGYIVEEQLFTRDEVYYADEAFFSGTAAELTPIRELDNRTIGEGHAGPVTKALQAAYFKAIKGQDPRYGHWLTNYKF
ncbi:MAG: branched-chain-amino-acid transaminase [Bilophila wadsworthia]